MLLLARAAGGEIHKEHDKPTQAVPLHPPHPLQGLGYAGSGGGWTLAGWTACPKLME